MSSETWLPDIIERLAANPLADRLLFFGSATDPARVPNDLDVFVDADPRSDRAGLQVLLQLARDFYGYLDPFFAYNGLLYVRSDEATHWVRARHERAIATAARAGVPLAELAELRMLRKSDTFSA